MSEPVGLVGPALRRWWRVVLLVSAALGLATTVALDTQDPESRQLQRAYLVGASTGGAALVTANTDRTARDAAPVLERDNSLVAEIGRVTGRDADSVRARLTVVHERGTSALRITYAGSSADEVLAAFDALDGIATTTGIPSAGIAPGALRPLQGSRDVVTRVDPVRSHPAWGLLVGLLVGSVSALLLERSRPRLLHRRHLQALTARSVLEIGSQGSEQVDVLATRLLRAEPQRVAVLVTSDDQHVRAADLADDLRIALARLGAPVPVCPATVDDLHGLAQGAPDPEVAWLLVVDERQRLRDVGDALDRTASCADLVLVVLPAVERVDLRRLAGSTSDIASGSTAAAP